MLSNTLHNTISKSLLRTSSSKSKSTFSRAAASFLQRQHQHQHQHQPSQQSILKQQIACFGTAEKSGSVMNAWEKSCYHEMDYTISEDATVYQAVEKFAGYDVGALIALDGDGKMAGVISERDYIKKVSLLGKTSKETKIKEIFTQDANVVVATVDDSIDVAMEKMMAKSIRHLPIVDNDKNLVGFVSIKDLIKEVVTDKEETLRALSDSVFGKGSWLNEGMIDWL